MLLNIKHTVHVHLHMYTDSFKLQAHFEPNFERDFAKEKKKSENTAINDAAKIGAPNNHLNSRLDLWSV